MGTRRTIFLGLVVVPIGIIIINIIIIIICIDLIPFKMVYLAIIGPLAGRKDPWRSPTGRPPGMRLHGMMMKDVGRKVIDQSQSRNPQSWFLHNQVGVLLLSLY